MRRQSRVAFLFSGGVLSTGIGLAVFPFLEATVSRVANREEAISNPAMVAELSQPTGVMVGQIMPVPLGYSTINGAIVPSGSFTPADPPTASAPRFAVKDLTALPGGAGFEASDLNNRGDVAGNYKSITRIADDTSEDGRTRRRYEATSRPAVFRSGKFENLSTPDGYNWVCATSINDSGQIAGAARALHLLPAQRVIATDTAPARVLLWDTAQMRDLSGDFYRLPEMENDTHQSRFILSYGDPVFVQNDGTVYAGFQNLYRWRAGAVKRYETGFVRGVNQRGVMIGAVPVRTQNINTEAFSAATTVGISRSPYYQPGLVETESGREIPLGRFSDDPCAINDSGTLILRGTRNGGATQFSLWDGKKQTPLATLPSCRGCRINNRGWVVMGDGMPEGITAKSRSHPLVGPFLKTGEGFFFLTDLLQEKDAWILSNVVGMNDQNQILIYGYRRGETTRRVLLLTPAK